MKCKQTLRWSQVIKDLKGDRIITDSLTQDTFKRKAIINYHGESVNQEYLVKLRSVLTLAIVRG